MMTTTEQKYNIVRFYRVSGRRKIMHRNVTLTVAQLHCRDKRTSKPGVYFDGYEEVQGQGTGYQGYANRATWNVVLWCMNTETIYRYVAKRAWIDPDDAMKLAYVWFLGGVTPDGCYLSEVNWKEVTAAFNECGL